MKPYVVCLMASSLDGRTHPSRWRPKGVGGDWFEMEDTVENQGYLKAEHMLLYHMNIGYPFVDEDKRPNTNLVVRSRDPEKLRAAMDAVQAMLTTIKSTR